MLKNQKNTVSVDKIYAMCISSRRRRPTSFAPSPQKKGRKTVYAIDLTFSDDEQPADSESESDE